MMFNLMFIWFSSYLRLMMFIICTYDIYLMFLWSSSFVHKMLFFFSYDDNLMPLFLYDVHLVSCRFSDVICLFDIPLLICWNIPVCFTTICIIYYSPRKGNQSCSVTTQTQLQLALVRLLHYILIVSYILPRLLVISCKIFDGIWCFHYVLCT